MPRIADNDTITITDVIGDLTIFPEAATEGSGLYGTTISWVSSDSTVDTNGAIVASGSTAAVTRPENGAGDQNITLTATVSKGGETEEASKTVDILITVLQKFTDQNAVDYDAARIEELIDFGSDGAKNNVINDITLPLTSDNGTTISWSSDKTDVIAIDEDTGNTTVTRPDFSHSANNDVTVALTATITKGDKSAEKTVTVTVKEMEPTDAEAVEAIAGDVKVTYDGTEYTTGTINGVTSNLNLSPAAGSGTYGTTISWANGGSVFVSTTGAVTRPTYTQGDKTATLTATVSRNEDSGASETKTFTVIITKAEMTDAEAVEAATVELTEASITYADDEDKDNVKNNITLQTTGTYDTTISWVSSDTTVDANGAIVVSGSTGTVTRPTYTNGDVSVTLTATVSRNEDSGASETKTFSVNITKAEMTDAEAVAAATADLTEASITYADGEDKDNVKNNITLQTTGSYGTTISWASFNTDAVTIDGATGIVQRSEVELTVTLTATVSKGGASDSTKSFDITLLPISMLKLYADSPTANEEFGRSCIISGDGNVAVIGTGYERFYIYEKSTTGWEQKQFFSSSTENFGVYTTVNYDGSVILVGSQGDYAKGITNSGEGYLYSRTGADNTWELTHRLIQDFSGFSVEVNSYTRTPALSGDGSTAIIGSDVSNIAGFGLVFKRTNGTWSYVTKITAPGSSIGDRFAINIALNYDGTRAIFGEVGGANGSAYVYKNNGASWSLEATLKGDPASGFPNFGPSVDISDDGLTAIVSAGNEYSSEGVINAGAIYVFEYSDNTWSKKQKITRSNPVENNRLGYPLSLSGDGNAILASFQPGGTNSGVSFYSRASSSDSFTFVQEFLPDTSSNVFGNSLSMSSNGTTAFIGQFTENDNSLTNTGAVYVYQNLK